VAAVRSGTLPAGILDDAVRRVLRALFAGGSVDTPAPGTLPGSTPASTTLPDDVLDRNEQTARQTAREGTVLLKNDDNALPLAAGDVDSIAVIGADADVNISGSNGFPPNPGRLTSILDDIRARAGAGVEVTHVEGTDPAGLGDTLPGLEPVPSSVLTPADTPAGARGLRADYFDNPTYAGAPFETRVERQVDIRGGISSILNNQSQQPSPPIATLFDPGAAMRWRGTLTTAETSDYTLGLSFLGSATLLMDGDPVVQGSTNPFDTLTATVRLVAGESHDVQIQYRADAPNQLTGDLAEGANPMIRFDWIPPSSAAVPGVQAAVDAADDADVAVVVAREYSGEGADRGTLKLPQGRTG